MKRLFFIVLALVVLLAVPVCAWTELTVTNSGESGGHLHSARNPSQFNVLNIVAFQNNVTRVNYDGDFYTGQSGTAATIPVTLKVGSQVVGNATCYKPELTGSFAAAHWEIWISDFNRGALTGTQGIKMYPTNGYNFALDYFHGTNTAAGTYQSTDPNSAMIWDSDYGWDMITTTYGGSEIITPVASFTCTPTSQYPDTAVVCTDTSTGNYLDWYWSIDAEALGIIGWQTNTSQNFTWQSHYPGLYSVNLRVNNSAGNDWENKTNYVSISENAAPNNCDIPPLAGYSRTSFQCTDAMSTGKINGCDIQLNDLEGGAWSNMTNTDGTWCIDTLPAHHINGYGQSIGYTNGSRLNVQEWNGQTYTILMIPGYVPPPATGYVWVYVHVTEFATATDLSGVTVSIQGTGLSTVSGVTDNSGVVHLQWPNATEAYINSAKPGYSTAMDVITTSDFGPDTVHVELHRGVHTMTIVPTTGPGGTVPTTAGPWGTPGPYGTMPSGYTNSQGQLAMDYLAANGLMLVQLCVFVTIAALLGFKLGGK